MAEEIPNGPPPEFEGGVELDENISFPSRPALETRPDGTIVENRPGAANGPEMVNHTYAITGKQLMEVCRLIDAGQTDEAIATLSDLVDVTEIGTDHLQDHGRVTVGELIQAEIESRKG